MPIRFGGLVGPHSEAPLPQTKVSVNPHITPQSHQMVPSRSPTPSMAKPMLEQNPQDLDLIEVNKRTVETSP